jgi:hypothetical protein
MVVKPDVAGSDTLEGLVRELLKPMLRDWLDANLPQIVEAMVAREILRGSIPLSRSGGVGGEHEVRGLGRAKCLRPGPSVAAPFAREDFERSDCNDHLLISRP